MKKKKRYANAKDVLPEELFEQIQKHYTGILWVPAPSRFYQERRDLVLALHQQPGDLQPRWGDHPPGQPDHRRRTKTGSGPTVGRRFR